MPEIKKFLGEDMNSRYKSVEIDKIDSRMEGVTDPIALIRMKNERNSWMPIIRLLPEDVFIEIMIALQLTFNDLDSDSIVNILKNDPERMIAGIMGDLGHWDWTVVTHVCHYWRQLAINCPKLWTRINTAAHFNVNKTKAYLERSKTMEISVNHFTRDDGMALNPRVHDACLIEVLEELHRICDLRIQINSDLRSKRIMKLFSQPAPKLRRLHFCWIDKLENTIAFMDNLGSLFSGSTPQLRHLLLFTYFLDWTSPLLKNLQSLTVRGAFYPLGLPELFTILDDCPELEELSIDDCEIVIEEDEVLSKVTMPKLRRLSLHSLKGRIYGKLIEYLDLPQELLYWVIGIDGLPCPEQEFVFPPIFKRETPCEQLSLRVSPLSLEINERTADNTRVNERYASMTISWELPATAMGVLQYAANFIEGEFWSDATVLQVSLSKEMDWLAAIMAKAMGDKEMCWTPLLEALPDLETIIVELHVNMLDKATASVKNMFKCALIALMDALSSTEEQSDEEEFSEEDYYLCPRLTKLVITSPLFGSCEEANNFAELQECLRLREEAGMPIKELVINDGHESKSKVFEALKKFGLVDDLSNENDVDDIQDEEDEEEDEYEYEEVDDYVGEDEEDGEEDESEEAEED